VTEVDGVQQIFKWGNEDREGIVLDEWFDLYVHTIEVNKPMSEVKFAILQSDLDWKYELLIDYVELSPTI
jgi:hypothetical protein